METMRLTLIFLHILIIIFATVNLHPHLTLISNASNHRRQISSIIGYTTELLCITLYHASSILAVWFSRRYGASLVRASGILLISELLQVMTWILQYSLDPQHERSRDFTFTVAYDVLLLLAVLITFRFAEKLSQHEKDLMQVELLADTVNDISTENYVEPNFI